MYGEYDTELVLGVKQPFGNDLALSDDAIESFNKGRDTRIIKSCFEVIRCHAVGYVYGVRLRMPRFPKVNIMVTEEEMSTLRAFCDRFKIRNPRFEFHMCMSGDIDSDYQVLEEEDFKRYDFFEQEKEEEEEEEEDDQVEDVGNGKPKGRGRS